MPTTHFIGLGPDLEHASERQMGIVDEIRSGPRGSVPLPFFAMLDAPDLALAIQEVGERLRFQGRLSDIDRELAILATAAAVGCEYKWRYHAPIALRAGLSRSDVMAAVLADPIDRRGNRNLVIIQFCRLLAKHGCPVEDVAAELEQHFDREQRIELVAIVGYHELLANFIRIGGHEKHPWVEGGPDIDQLMLSTDSPS